MTRANKALWLIGALCSVAITRPALAQNIVEMEVSTVESYSGPTFLSIASGNAAAMCRNYSGYVQGYSSTLYPSEQTIYTGTCIDTAPEFSETQYVFVYHWVLPDPLAAGSPFGTCYFADGPWDATELKVYSTTRCLNP
jgi:hypothetical protein